MLAKTLNAFVFISLHCNHSDNPNAKGEIYGLKMKSRYSGDSIWIALQLQAASIKDLRFEGKGMKFANFQMFWDTNGFWLEIGFLSNRDEAAYAKTANGKNALAWIILSSIQNYFGK